MSKTKIHITEEQLTNVIKEELEKHFYNSHEGPIKKLDLTKFPIEDLRKAYRDLRYTSPLSFRYDDPLASPGYIKEAMGDIMPPDEVVEKIRKRFNLPESTVFKAEHYHQIYVYVVLAHIGVNDKLIEESMEKLGYFMSKDIDVDDIEDMVFKLLQFEPYSQYQEDITDDVKNQCEYLLHWTPSYNVKSIMKDGLIPSCKNTEFNYPERIYLIDYNSSENQIRGLGQQICNSNNDPRNNGQYAILYVNLSNLADNVRFYYDPNSSIGIYTEKPIPPKNIQVGEEYTFVKNIKK